jgi:hypothetical protein
MHYSSLKTFVIHPFMRISQLIIYTSQLLYIAIVFCQPVRAQYTVSNQLQTTAGITSLENARTKLEASLSLVREKRTPDSSAQNIIDWSSIVRDCQDFQEKYPDSPRFAEARKLELTAKLIPLKGTGSISAALKTSTEAYLSDLSVPEADRFDISHMLKNAAINIKQAAPNGRLLAQRFENAKALADEYPNDPRAWRDLLWLSQQTNQPPDHKQWAKSNASGSIPSEIKSQLSNLQRRFALIGNVLPQTDMHIPPGKPVVLYFWSVNALQFSEILWQCALLEDVAFVGVNVDENSTKAKAFADQLSLPGHIYYDGVEGPIKTNLHIDATPAIFILDGQGKVLDVNGRFRLVSKLREISGGASIDQKALVATGMQMGGAK